MAPNDRCEQDSGRGCGLGGVGAAQRHCPLLRNRTHPQPFPVLQPMRRACGLSGHHFSRGGCSWLLQKKLAPQICNFVCFSFAGGKWTLCSSELVSSWSSARSCLPTISLLQTSTRLFFFLRSPLLTKLAEEGKKMIPRKRHIFCQFLIFIFSGFA